MEPTDLIIVCAAVLLGALAIGAFLLSRRISRTRAAAPAEFAVGLAGRVVAVALAFLIVAGLIPVGVVSLGIAIFVAIEGYRKYRASGQYALLWLLCVSAERSIPLVPAIEAYANERRGRFGRRARWLAGMLQAGVPLPDALDDCPNLVPSHAIPMIHVGYQSGALAPALRQAATMYTAHEPVWMALLGKLTYLIVVIEFSVSILLYVLLKLLPEYQKIFGGFGTSLPRVTEVFFTVSQAAVDLPFFWLFFLMVDLLALYAVVRYLGWIRWEIPPLARLLRRLDSANLMDGLALVAGRHRPMLDGVIALAQSYPKAHIRRRLGDVASEMRSGRDWCESLYAHRLIGRAEFGVLQAAQRVDNLPWALREMADSSRRRFTYRLQAITQALFPLVVILVGSLVAFCVVALFHPLVCLISTLC